MSEKKDISHWPLLEEANREAWKSSAYWRIDHPFPDDLDYSVPPRPNTAGELLEGVREAVAGAEKMLGHVIQRRANAGRIIELACTKVREEIRQYMPNAVAGVLGADLRRAKSDLAHWQDYERFYAAQEGTKPLRELNNSAFTPPWAGEELVLEDGVPF